MDLFPYQYRPGQGELVRFISESVSDGMCPVVEAGTGTGKTVSALAGTLSVAMERGLKVVYLTRTKSQQKQVVREAAAIGHGVLCVALQGRSAASCPMMRDDPELASGTPEEISKLCSEYKRRTDGQCHCRFYANIEHTDIDEWVETIRERHPEPEEFARMCEDAELCPYELLKYALPHADVIAASYPFVFLPQVLGRLEEWTGTPLHRMVIVVDEAHNLPDYLRDVQTFEYSSRALDLAEKEARDNGDSEVHDGLTVTDIIAVLREIMGHAVKEYLIEDDGILPPYFLEDELMSRLGTTSVNVMRICQGLEDLGDSISERKRQRRKLPRSYIGSMGAFIRAWISGAEDCHVRLIIGGSNPCFQSYCMDPSGASGPLNDCYASVHMSGTLEPMDSYVSDLGLDRPVVRRIDGFFPRENLLTLYTDEVSMRYEDRFIESNYRRLRELLVSTVNSVHVNTAVFFPSSAGADGGVRHVPRVRGQRPALRDWREDKRGSGLPGQEPRAGGHHRDPFPQAHGQDEGDDPLLRCQVRRWAPLRLNNPSHQEDEAVDRASHQVRDRPRRGRDTRPQGRDHEGDRRAPVRGHPRGGAGLLLLTNPACIASVQKGQLPIAGVIKNVTFSHAWRFR